MPPSQDDNFTVAAPTDWRPRRRTYPTRPARALGCPSGCPLGEHDPSCILGGRDYWPRGLANYDESAVWRYSERRPFISRREHFEVAS